jgi:Ca2+-binding RTX toxin-like protein
VVFKISDFAVYYGVAGLPGNPSPADINNWGFDTVILASRQLMNIGADNFFDAGSLIAARGANPERDVLGYISVGQAQRYLDGLEAVWDSAGAADWKGAATVSFDPQNQPVVSQTLFWANYWTAGWFDRLKVQADFVIASGASGMFLDVTDAIDSDIVAHPNGERAGVVAMLKLIGDLAAYARMQSGDPEFRVVVNRESYQFMVKDLLADPATTPAETTIINAYLSAVSGIIYESLILASSTDVARVSNNLIDTYLARGIDVVMLDDDQSAITNLATAYGFVPSYSQNALDYALTPRLDGLGLNRATALQDTLFGSPDDDVIAGLAGTDTIRGGGGDDTIFGGSAAVDPSETGNDFLYGNEGMDTIYGNGGDDLIVGGLGADFLIGGTGNDTLYGGLSDTDTADLSDDFMRGGDGTDVLYGNGGNDNMLGGAGIDTLYGGDGNDLLYGGALLVDATDFGDTIYGGNGNDDIRGNGGADFLYGEGGDDSVIGGVGADNIFGGLGNDYLRGGLDADRFIFDTTLNAATNVDTIQNFVLGEDKIVLLQAIFTQIGATLDAAEFQLGAVANDINDRIIYNSATGQLFYDANGNVNGSADQIQFALLTVASGALPVLTISDFVMV